MRNIVGSVLDREWQQLIAGFLVVSYLLDVLFVRLTLLAILLLRFMIVGIFGPKGRGVDHLAGHVGASEVTPLT